MNCGVGCRCGSDPELPWLWRRPAATALIGFLVWEPPYATGAALGKVKRQKKKKKFQQTKAKRIQQYQTQAKRKIERASLNLKERKERKGGEKKKKKKKEKLGLRKPQSESSH